MKIVFMGTPEFGVPSLEALVAAGFDVAACCTQPDRPQGRKMTLTPCPVKLAAQKHGIEVLQFERIRRQEGLDAMRAIRPDLYVTAAFGQILSQKLLDIPKIGTVNVHPSLLPKYRGPAPVNWSIIEGETRTGVTTMMTDAGMDTGDILLVRETELSPDEDAAMLSERLARVGAELLVETLRRIEAGDCPRRPQDNEAASYFPMLTKETGRIDWMRGARRVVNLVRGVVPWPGAWTEFGEGVLKIWKASPAAGEGKPGEVLSGDAKNGLVVACGEGAVRVEELQAPGAKRMPAEAYLRGKPIEKGLILGKESITNA